MNILKVTLIQTELHWEDISANLGMFEEKIWDLSGQTDIILLPEMFNTGFTMNVEKCAEPVNFTTLKWMKQMAAQLNAVIAGSYIIKEEQHYYNRLYCVMPDGHYVQYDKRHLFRMGDEHLNFTPGRGHALLHYQGWNIMPLICYDLRFPVWSRNRINENTQLPEYDLLIYLSNWPAPRNEVWDTLLRARALENQCYCAGVNRIGTDGMNVHYTGHSAMYDYKGRRMNNISETPGVFTIEISLTDLKEFRMRFPAYLDSDDFTLN